MNQHSQIVVERLRIAFEHFFHEPQEKQQGGQRRAQSDQPQRTATTLRQL